MKKNLSKRLKELRRIKELIRLENIELFKARLREESKAYLENRRQKLKDRLLNINGKPVIGNDF